MRTIKVTTQDNPACTRVQTEDGSDIACSAIEIRMDVRMRRSGQLPQAIIAVPLPILDMKCELAEVKVEVERWRGFVLEALAIGGLRHASGCSFTSSPECNVCMSTKAILQAIGADEDAVSEALDRMLGEPGRYKGRMRDE